MVKDEEETEKDDPPHRATDNGSRPSSIVLTIGIIAITDADTSGGTNSSAGRLALLAEWVSRIEGMRDLARTDISNAITTCHKLLGGGM